MHRCLKQVGECLEELRFNTGIAAMMTLMNEVEGKPFNTGQAEIFTLMLAPYAPHLAEELWARLGHTKTLAYEPWPNVNPALLADSELELPIQVNGKVRSRLTVAVGTSDEQIKAKALADPAVIAHLNGQAPKKVIIVPNKLVSVVV